MIKESTRSRASRIGSMNSGISDSNAYSIVDLLDVSSIEIIWFLNIKHAFLNLEKYTGSFDFMHMIRGVVKLLGALFEETSE